MFLTNDVRIQMDTIVLHFVSRFGIVLIFEVIFSIIWDVCALLIGQVARFHYAKQLEYEDGGGDDDDDATEK